MKTLLFLRYYGYYRKQRMKNKEQLKRYQERKIAKLLTFVCRRSAYYASYAGKPLEAFPIMDKITMMEHFNAINTVAIDRDEALKLAIDGEKKRKFTNKLKHISVGLSSGTSSHRGIFLVDSREQVKWAGYILARFIPKCLLKGHKIAFFMRADNNLYQSLNSKSVEFVFFDIYQNMEENICHLEALKPDIIVGQPSVLLEIRKAKVSPAMVISIAEVLETKDGKTLADAFHVPFIHQVYQCTEGCLATTCLNGNLHLNEDIVHIEKEYLDQKRFLPIITDFSRTSQPMLRYRLNDILVEKTGKCPCGSPFTMLEHIEGREDDVFLFDGPDGRIVKVFPDFIRRCILFVPHVPEYKILQKKDGGILVYADIGEDTRDAVTAEFEKLANDKQFLLPEIVFEAYFYDKKRKLKRIESMRQL